MANSRCTLIELLCPEPEKLEAVIHSRRDGGASPLDYIVAVVVSGSAVALPGYLVISPDQLALLVGAGVLFGLVVGVPGTAAVRKLRQRLGKPELVKLTFEPGALRGQPVLRLGDRTIEACAVTSVGLLGWQEVAATDRIWDVTLLSEGGSVDVVSGHASEEEARELAKALATALHVELRESSTTGGPVSPVCLDHRGLPRAG